MVSGKDEESIDFRKLEKELSAAVEADAKYWRENDAKLRAVEQRVETYEEFKGIVAAAHIKPLDKKDKISEIEKLQAPWNPHATAKDGKGIKSEPLEEDKSKIPKNGHEFARDWKRYCKTNSDKYDFLIRIGGEQLGIIFKLEIAFGLLGDILVAMEECFIPSDVDVVVSILDSLSKADRFALSLDFLSTVEKDCCQKLFLKMQCLLDAASHEVNFSEDSLQSLMQTYNVV